MNELKPTAIPLSFRKGGDDGLEGIWISIHDEDFLVNPLDLARSLESFHTCDWFFTVSVSGKRWKQPSMQVVSTEADPVLGDYIWSFGELISTCYWEHDDYQRKVILALAELYRHVVWRSMTSAYAAMSQGTMVRVMEELLGSKDGLPLRGVLSPLLKPEPFRAVVIRGTGLSLHIGNRELTLPTKNVEPRRLRHDLEHIVLYSESHLLFKGKLLDFEEDRAESGEILLHRPIVRRVDSLPHSLRHQHWMAVIAYYDDQDGMSTHQIAGLCNEKEVIFELYKGLITMHRKAGMSDIIDRYLIRNGLGEFVRQLHERR